VVGGIFFVCFCLDDCRPLLRPDPLCLSSNHVLGNDEDGFLGLNESFQQWHILIDIINLGSIHKVSLMDLVIAMVDASFVSFDADEISVCV